MKFRASLVLLAACAMAQDAVKHQHLIDPSRALTAPSSRPAAQIAREFVEGQSASLGLDATALEGLYTARQYTDAHNGVTHIVYRQRFRGIDVVNAAYSVNLDSTGQVLNAGGGLAKAPEVASPTPAGMAVAVRAAVTAVNPKAAENYTAVPSMQRSLREGAVRFAEIAPDSAPEGRMVWFRGAGGLIAAYEVFATAEDGITNYQVLVDGQGLMLRRSPMTFFQKAKGLVYERESPQPNPTPGVLLLEAPPYVERTVQSFDGDPKASPSGWVTDNQTAGNNTVVGENLLGIRFSKDIVPTTTTENDFSFPIWVGPGAASPLNYADAINTNLFYWINRAHDLFYESGFTEAAGNFQFDNLGKGGTGGDGLWAYTHFGASARGAAATDNAFFSWRDNNDGSQPMIAMYIASGGGQYVTDGSLDSVIIVHEYTHGVTNRVLPSGYDSFQVAAMGEAWSDFYGLEFTIPMGADPDGVYPTSQYFSQNWGQDSARTRPYTTDINQNPLTFSALGNVIGFQEVHADGEIWMLALWEARANLIRQFGEAEGRRRIRLLVLDGCKLAPAFPTMVEMRDAILLADRVNFQGASQSQLWAAFAKRGLGALAISQDPDTTHVLASFDLPSPKATMSFIDPANTAGDLVQLVMQDANNAQPTQNLTIYTDAGDVETVTLRRYGSVFYGSIPTSLNPISLTETALNRNNGFANAKVGGYVNAYYDDVDTGFGGQQISASVQVNKTYSAFLGAQAYPAFARTTRLSPSDVASRVTLPFEFPFFGKRYRSAYVHRNGLISFGEVPIQSQVTFGCMDRSVLAKIPGIAALWSNLSITGTAQAGEGLWMSPQTDGSVVFLWAGETIAARPEAVNLAVRLNVEGQIQVNYGTGNAEVGAASTVFGCGAAPVIGLSPGFGTTAFTFTLPMPINNQILTFEPPFSYGSFPKITVESPQPDATTNGVMTVSGIVYDEGAAYYATEAMVDGTKVGMSTARVNRADFCSRQNVPGCPNVGFVIDLDTSTLSPGQHTLQLRASNVRQGITEAPPITFNIGERTGRIPTGRIESPAENQTVSGAFTIRGYVHGGDLRITGVDTLIDGVTYGPTQYGLNRADICTGLPAPAPVNCPAIGFQLNINSLTATPPLSNNPHTLQIRVVDASGRYTYFPEQPMVFSVRNEDVKTGGAITSIKPGDVLRGVVDISGYMYSNASRGLLNSAIRVDVLYSYGTVRLNLPAPDACDSLQGVTACPNVGFAGTLDTRVLTNGPHTIQVLGLDSDGRTITLPAVGSPVMSVIVDNPQ